MLHIQFKVKGSVLAWLDERANVMKTVKEIGHFLPVSVF